MSFLCKTFALVVALLLATTVEATEQHTPILLTGALLSSQSAQPIPNAAIQIWQTSPSTGMYSHPQSGGIDLNTVSSTDDTTFRYFGTATTNANGTFAFRTYKPAPYTTASRPSHIHFKVWLSSDDRNDEDGAALTSQFYFREDGTQTFESLLLDLNLGSDVDGKGVLSASKHVVIDVPDEATIGDTELQPTPRQAEGPFYPTVDFFGMDGDLTKSDVAVATDGGAEDNNMTNVDVQKYDEAEANNDEIETETEDTVEEEGLGIAQQVDRSASSSSSTSTLPTILLLLVVSPVAVALFPSL